MAAALQSTSSRNASGSTSSTTTTTVSSAATTSTNMEGQSNPERRSSSLRSSGKRASKKSSTNSTSGNLKTSRHKIKKAKSHSDRSSNPKELLTKDKRPNPQVPPQLGNINPLATDTQKLEDSLRWNSLNNSVSTAPTNDSTTDYTTTGSFAQQSQQSFLVLPSTPNSSSSIHTGSKATLLVAHPDEDTSSNSARGELANLIQQAVGRVVQNATENGALLTPTLPQVQSTSPGLQETVKEMQQQLKEQKQLFLDFQKQMLLQQEQQQTQIQQQAKLLEQQQTLLEAQQKQLLDLKNDMLMQSQQSARSQPRSVLSTPTELHATPASSSPVRNKRQQQQRKSMDVSDMQNSLGAFQQLQQSNSQSQQFEGSFALDTPAAAQLPANHSDSFVQSHSSSFAHSKNSTSYFNSNDILNREDSNATIETDYEDDSDYQADSDEEDRKQDSPPSSPNNKPSSETTASKEEKEVEVWVCPSCKFEHEFSMLHFCGVCGEPRPNQEKENQTDTPTNATVTTTPKESQSPKALTRSSSSSYFESSSPIPPQEPLIQLQLHKELQGSSHGNENLDLPPKSPHRKKMQYRRSNSTTNIPPKQRSRQQRLQRSKTQEPEQLRATYHGASRKDSIVVKCIDGGDAGAVFDIDVLNQQLSTFESSKQEGPAGSAPTASAPKTPKVNKRKTIRRTKSALDEPDDEQPVAPPAVFGGSGTSKPNPSVRQAIPRRAKSTSTEQLRMHQIQQQGGAMQVPPIPAANKPRTSIFGSAVSALHKSPKKAITALKIAGNSMPKSLMLGGGGGNHNKGKNHAFLLDSDDENGDEGNATAASTSTARGRSDSVDANEQASTEPPPTPRTQARARASVASGQKTGWKKWFDSGSKNPSAASAAAAEEEEPELELDIDDSVHVDDDDLFEGADASEDEPEAAPRNRRRRRSTGRVSASGNLRSSVSRRRDHMENQLRSSAHTAGGSNRNLQGSNHGGSNSVEANMRGSRLDVLATPRRSKPRIRRTKSLESPGAEHRGSGRRLTSSQTTTDSSGQLLIVPSGGSGSSSSHHNPNNNKPSRDGNNRRRRSSVEGRPSCRRLPSSELSTADAENGATKKSDHMKHRVQGLRKSNAESANSNSANPESANANATTTPSKAAASSTTDDGSEYDDGCSIYLDMSIGAMSEITHIF